MLLFFFLLSFLFLFFSFLFFLSFFLGYFLGGLFSSLFGDFFLSGLFSEWFFGGFLCFAIFFLLTISLLGGFLFFYFAWIDHGVFFITSIECQDSFHEDCFGASGFDVVLVGPFLELLNGVVLIELINFCAFPDWE